MNGAKLRGIAFRRLERARTMTIPLLELLVSREARDPMSRLRTMTQRSGRNSLSAVGKRVKIHTIPPTHSLGDRRQEPLLHTSLDYDMCIQAGYGDKVEHGTKLRLNECDEDNELQRWDVALGGPMKLSDNKYGDLCVASRGNHFDLEEDDMIMVHCDLLGEECGRGCYSFD